jgi:hypothetical protein
MSRDRASEKGSYSLSVCVTLATLGSGPLMGKPGPAWTCWHTQETPCLSVMSLAGPDKEDHTLRRMEGALVPAPSALYAGFWL